MQNLFSPYSVFRIWGTTWPYTRHATLYSRTGADTGESVVMVTL